ncbi:MAG: hypothetical protein AB2L24_05730 [Mangrovibacterium sp.]
MMKHLLPILLLLLLFIGYSCDNNDDDQEEIKISNFSSPEEFIENPSVSDAIAEASITIYEGNNPPALAGNYLADGEVTDISDYTSGLNGTPYLFTNNPLQPNKFRKNQLQGKSPGYYSMGQRRLYHRR